MPITAEEVKTAAQEMGLTEASYNAFVTEFNLALNIANHTQLNKTHEELIYTFIVGGLVGISSRYGHRAKELAISQIGKFMSKLYPSLESAEFRLEVCDYFEKAYGIPIAA